MKRLFFVVYTIFSLSLVGLKAKDQGSGFAIVVDKTSYEKAKTELGAYAQSLKNDGLYPVFVIDRWYQPDSIRKELMRLYQDKKHPIEGAVFVGDIPVPMIRDAQHLTSAFKMNQDRFEWSLSSVPSDRFYDDFDLTFQFLKQDSAKKSYFYYSLKESSPQRLKPEIYSGRIKPFENSGKYNQLKLYLQKLVRIRQGKKQVQQFLYFGGHGYNSESTMARVDEKITLLEQFPRLKQQNNAISYIDHSMDVHVKPRLLSELQRLDLDIALLHHHGDVDIQYLNGTPKVDNVNGHIEGIKYYLRSKLQEAFRKGKDTTEVVRRLVASYHVPAEWFYGALNSDVVRKDSLFEAGLNIHIPDVLSATPNARFIILDACFNGSFQLDEYIAGAYIFNQGNTVAVQANTVNALQDKWSNEFLGLLGTGLRVGQWNGLTGYLESHIIGDPSFRFDRDVQDGDASQIISTEKKNAGYWVKQLKAGSPEFQALALRMLFNLQYRGLSDLLLSTFKSSPYGIVRMECLKLLTAYNDSNFLVCLAMAADDAYEFIQRQAVYLIGKSGNPLLTSPLVHVAMRNNTSERIEFNLKEALSFYGKDSLVAAFERIFATEQHFVNSDTVRRQILQSVTYNSLRWVDDVQEILNPATSDKKVVSGLRFLRNYNMHAFVPSLCDLALNSNNINIQIVAIEALGWFNISYQKTLIIKTCRELAQRASTSQGVKNEALKTINRLETPWYR